MSYCTNAFVPRFSALMLVTLASLVTSLYAQNDYATPYVISTVSGTGSAGYSDGAGSAARFAGPSAAVVDSAGNVYVADTSNNTIRKIAPAGTVTTIAGLAGFAGSADGAGSLARFNSPVGIALDEAGYVYIADSGNNTIRRVSSAGVVTTLAGTAGLAGYADGTGSSARFAYPTGVAVDGSGNVYVADSMNKKIRKISPVGEVVTLVVTGYFGALSGVPFFYEPVSVVLDHNGNLYIADRSTDSIRKVTSAGVGTVLAGPGGPNESGSIDGTGYAARFFHPSGVAVDGAGNVYVADTINGTIRKVTPSGVVTTFAGTAGTTGSTDGTSSAARFNYPFGVTVDGTDNVYVADIKNNTIRKISPAGLVTTFAGIAPGIGSIDGEASDAKFNYPSGVATDGAGTIYVADSENFTVRKITSDGIVSTFAGTAGTPGSADGMGSSARFFVPRGVAVDRVGNIYVGDSPNSTVRKITPDGLVSTLAGAVGLMGSADGSGSGARFTSPHGLAVDGVGNVFVADSNSYTIRKITPAGEVTTLAGLAGQSGLADGIGSNARFGSPTGVAVDTTGNLFVADWANRTIRKITPTGVVSTFAGAAGVRGSIDGTGSAARFDFPSGLAIDGSGNLFVVDNHTIRKITAAGVVTTLAGTPDGFGSVDGIGSDARFDYPTTIAIDTAGTLYFSDSSNQTIRKGVLAAPSVPLVTTQPVSHAVTSNSVVTFTVVASGFPAPTYQWRKDGVNVSGATGSSYTIAAAVLGDAGSYSVIATNSAGSVTSNPALLTVTTDGASDFDGDGKSDILLSNTATGDRAMWFMNGTAIGTNAFAGTVPTNWVVSGTGDFDGDGKADIFWTNTTTGDRAAWLMNGNIPSLGGYLGNIPVEWVVSGTGDFNGDGKADIVWTNTSTGERSMWLMNGLTASAGASLGVAPVAWAISGTGDFNGDGKSDIMLSNTTTGDRVIWFMNGTTIGTNAFAGTVPPIWSVSGVGDFDGDGKADIFWSNTTTGDRAVWLMNGNTNSAGGYLGAIPVEWVVSATGDYNGDGKADILWTNTSTGERAMWLMNGLTTSGGASLGVVPVAWVIAQ